MKYSQFLQQVEQQAAGCKVVSSAQCYGKLVQETADGQILVDRQQTCFVSLEEAREHIRQQKLREDLEEEIQQEQYTEISNNKIADIIKQHHSDIKVTDTLIESYVELASSKLFTTNPIALDIRSLNKLDRLFENHIDFQLDDGSTIVISEQMQRKINNAFEQHSDVVDYMRTSKENFLSVLNQLED